MNVRALVLIAIGVIVLGVTVFFVQRRSQPSLGPSPARTPLAPVVYPTFPPEAARSQPNYVVTVPTPLIPTQITAYSFRPPITLRPQAILIANTLGIRTNPTEITGTRGTLYSWQDGDNTLVVGGDPIEISYLLNATSKTPLQIAPQQIDGIVQQFMTRIGILNQLTTLVPIKQTYFAPTKTSLGELPGPQGATIAEATYAYKLGDWPFVSRFPDMPAVTARINGDGRVIAFTGHWYPGVQKSQAAYSLISFQEATARLSSGEGVLLALSPQEKINTDIPQKFSLATSSVSRVGLSYYYTPGNALLAPVFVFYGQGVDTKTNKGVDTVTVVSALPSQAPTP